MFANVNGTNSAELIIKGYERDESDRAGKKNWDKAHALLSHNSISPSYLCSGVSSQPRPFMLSP